MPFALLISFPTYQHPNHPFEAAVSPLFDTFRGSQPRKSSTFNFLVSHFLREMYSAIHSLPLDGGVAHADFQGSLDGTNLPGDACLVLTTDPKPRLRWTAELHERFVDAVTQLGGPDSAFSDLLLSPYLFNLNSFLIYHVVCVSVISISFFRLWVIIIIIIIIIIIGWWLI